MPSKRTSKNYTIQLFQIGPDKREIDLLMINFHADSLASAQAQTMIYLRNDTFVKGIDGAKLLRDAAEVWRWRKGKEAE
ncbi:hypothetical protein [Bradyrhizobium sp.]|jgi:hypothetical protein|uniref:hypothetical protein n=1 Tax=Bradyrhizobium sp. TaxID=376 RepID=UPI002DF8CCD4|nr:hypothetical protein [Bradyrhizobium sp.]